jgi:hypothetical protein
MLRIPHFYHAFYVQVNHRHLGRGGAFQRVLGGNEGAGIPTEFSSPGGSAFPLEALKAAGVDITSAPIASKPGLFEKRLSELEKLLQPSFWPPSAAFFPEKGKTAIPTKKSLKFP